MENFWISELGLSSVILNNRQILGSLVGWLMIKKSPVPSWRFSPGWPCVNLRNSELAVIVKKSLLSMIDYMITFFLFRNFLCILATQNIIEKIFLFLWFCFLFLLIASITSLVYFSLLLLSRSQSIRNYFLSFAVTVKVNVKCLLLFKS